MGKARGRAFQTEQTACAKGNGIGNMAKERRHCGCTQQEQESDVRRGWHAKALSKGAEMMRFTCSKAHSGCSVEDRLEGSQDDVGRRLRSSFNSLWEVTSALIKEVARKSYKWMVQKLFWGSNWFVLLKTNCHNNKNVYFSKYKIKCHLLQSPSPHIMIERMNQSLRAILKPILFTQLAGQHTYQVM